MSISHSARARTSRILNRQRFDHPGTRLYCAARARHSRHALAPDAETLRQGVFLHFEKQPCSVVDGKVRTIVPDGAKFVVEAAAAFPNAIRGISYRKPSLEDVFLKETGARL